MRTTLSQVAIAAMFATLGFSQTPDRTFYLTNMTSPAELNALTTAIRTIVHIQDISTDEPRHALVAHGTVDQMVATEWMVHQLDQPAGAAKPGASTDYRMAGENGETVRIFRLDPTMSNANLTAIVTAVRTVADVQQLFPFPGQGAFVARASLDKIEATDWMVRQLAPADGKALTADSPTYPTRIGLRPEMEDEAIRVFRMDPSATNAALTGMVTTLRTVGDIQRLFPFEAGKAVVVRTTANRMAVAEWLLHELNQPSHAAAFAETRMNLGAKDQPATDNMVRVFYVAGTNAQVTKLVTDIRTTANVQRIFPYVSGGSEAVVMRGRADQMATAESMVAKFGKQ
jgi:hypothetical protein